MSGVVLRAKVAVLGDSGVGKTALTQMFTSGAFPKSHRTTSGMDLAVASVPIEGSKATVELFLCDISGHDMFTDITPSLLHGVNMVILVYDQCSRSTFEACEKLLRAVPTSGAREVRGVLVGNKHDLVGHVNYDADGDGAVTAEEEAVASEKLSKLRPREVSVEEARRWAESRNLTFFETSAVPPGTKLDAPFKWCAETFHSAYERQLKQLTTTS